MFAIIRSIVVSICKLSLVCHQRYYTCGSWLLKFCKSVVLGSIYNSHTCWKYFLDLAVNLCRASALAYRHIYNLSSISICQSVASRWHTGTYICRGATHSHFTSRFDISWNVNLFIWCYLVIFDNRTLPLRTFD